MKKASCGSNRCRISGPSGSGIDTQLDDPAVQPALQTPLARAYLAWSRFPFAAVEPSGIWLNDYRYANVGLGGWSAVKGRAEDPDTMSACA